jgi:hypothetical protein
MNKTTFFKVRGRGTFPIDMLRYDECYPVDPQSVENIEVPQKRVTREVHLATNKRFGPTEGRWQSFNWNVYWDHS